MRISSGLGAATPLNIIVLPVLFEGSVRAVVELASFSAFSPIHQTFLDQLTESIGLVLNTMEADTLTENLLVQSQSQAEQLEDNPDRNMTAKQVEYASVIRASGNDLLTRRNGILDLAEVESGTVTLHEKEVAVEHLCATLHRELDPVAREKHLGFAIDISPDGPEALVTDHQRLRQVVKNLLANPFKFTERGDVHVQVGPASSGWSEGARGLSEAPSVLAIAVRDTGIGIAPEHHLSIFDEFSQADGTTARLYGGTGLGLSISRELVGLLGGEIAVASAPGMGSTFTVYLPVAGGLTLSPRSQLHLSPSAAPSRGTPTGGAATCSTGYGSSSSTTTTATSSP